MKKLVATMHAPGRLTVLAALLAGLSVPAVAASPNLVISQIYGAGGNAGTTFYKFDYIEIFNRGTTAVTATGWSVQYGSAGSTAAWSGKSALPTFTVEPGQYVLIQQQGGGGAQAALPTPVIVVPPGFNMSGTAGKLALVNDTVTLSGATPVTANVVDLIGFGTTANGSETAPAPAGGNALALFRAQGGCIDTDNNSLDFVTGAPAPRTSDSPINACGGPVAAPIVLACPASLALEQGAGGMVTLTGTDADSIVNGASITGAATAGISLAGFTAASANGGAASVSLQVAANVGAGSHPVTVRFANNAGQEKSCTVTVAVTGVASISQIQGSGDTSPFNNQVVITEGVVTHKVGNGYFLQDNGDGNPDTSDGLFVFTPGAVNVGERLRVRGSITEFRPTGAPLTYTEMKDVTSTTVLSSGNSITPANISFDGTQDLERYEGMLVSINNSLTINQSSFLGTRGELTLAAGRRETATNRYRPLTPEAIALAAANARNSLVLDDSLFVAPTVIPYIDGGARVVRAGDTVTGLTGVIDYGSIGGGAGYKLQYTVEPMFSATNPRTGAPQLGAGIKVASANVLNYFTTFTDGTNTDGETGVGCQLGATSVKEHCRGADNAEEFARQTNKIVSALLALDADVVGLMEIQNNGNIATAYLAQQLNSAVGFQAYAHVPAPAATGTDAIRVSMLYKPAKVQLVGAAMSDADPVNTRPPMAQTFKAGNGGKFSLVVNHMHAKASSCSGVNADQGDGQGCSNVRRTQQATRLANDFIPQIISAAGDPDVLVMGDLNANGQEDPIYTLTQSGLVNQLERFVRPAATPYSYVFNGEVGYLDHALTTASLDAQMTGAAQWHNNADEPTIIDYNLDGKNAAALALIEDHAYRSSDHDPVVVSMNLPATVTDVSAGFTVQRSAVIQNRVTGKISATLTLTNVSGKPMTGPFYVQFTNLTPGVIVENATGMKDGMYYITVNNASIAPGAKATLSAVYINPNKVVFGHTNKVFNGTY